METLFLGGWHKQYPLCAQRPILKPNFVYDLVTCINLHPDSRARRLAAPTTVHCTVVPDGLRRSTFDDAELNYPLPYQPRSLQGALPKRELILRTASRLDVMRSALHEEGNDTVTYYRRLQMR